MKPLLPLVPRVPEVEDRLRRFTEIVALLLNGLIDKGLVFQTGPADWNLTISLTTLAGLLDALGGLTGFF